MKTLNNFFNKSRLFKLVLVLMLTPVLTATNRGFVKKSAKMNSILVFRPSEPDVEFQEKEEIHMATWYDLPKNRTYSGERFYTDSLTAAYNYNKMGTLLRITNLRNNKSVIVKVNDKMGLKKKNRIDLSYGAFKAIGKLERGKIKVKVEEVINR